MKSAVRRAFTTIWSALEDSRGVAALEGIIAVVVLAGVFLASLFLTQWGTGLQSAHMGGRLLAFDAGDTILAKLGKPANQPTQQSALAIWDTLISDTTAERLNNLFSLQDSYYSGGITGRANGRLPGQSALFAYAPTAMGYYAQNRTESDAWVKSDSATQSMFLHIAYGVGFTQLSPYDVSVDSMSGSSIPHTNRVLDSILVRVGVW